MREKSQFSEILDSLLVKRGVNPTAFARKLGLAHKTVQNFLAGDTFPRSDNLLAMADELGVTTDYLLTGAERGSVMVQCQTAGQPAPGSVDEWQARAQALEKKLAEAQRKLADQEQTLAALKKLLK